MSGTGTTTIMRALAINDKADGTHPIIRRIILERFLWARQHTAERVIEKTTQDKILLTTYMMYDKDTNLICEDVVVESRPSLG